MELPVRARQFAGGRLAGVRRQLVVVQDGPQQVEGIGPKIQEVLQAAGINTHADLAAKSADEVKEILAPEGGVIASRDTSTWPAQAQMAADGEWEKLRAWQDELDGGKE